MSDLSCDKEGVPIHQCTCPDIDARLKAASDSPDVMFKWCRVCDRHFARCHCPAPAFYLRSGGQEVPIPEGGFRTASGRWVIPDLSRR